MRKKQHLRCGPLCSFPCARALRCLYFPSFFFFYRSCRFFLCLGKEPRKQHRTRKSKRWKTFFIIFFSVLIIKLFFPRDAEAVLLTLLKNNQMKQRKRKTDRRKERIHSIATTVILHLNKIVYSYF